ncbi:hypothetical protein AWB71_05801 [Caballeronia peredens]|nr:hypothetical protein AWB71_05801 [Caballeronia peredens]
MHRDEFLAVLSSEGFDEVVTVTREPNGVLDAHTHPFEAKALILEGKLTIRTIHTGRTNDNARTYHAGDVFHLAANTEHSEQYGPEGVSYLVGRK